MCVPLLAGALIVGINAEVKAQPADPPPGSHRIPKDKANSAGCYVPDADTLPVTVGQLPPCATGVPKEASAQEWKCPGVGDSPNQTCHWAYENRLGCQNGGAGLMCDTVAVAGGTECNCVEP